MSIKTLIDVEDTPLVKCYRSNFLDEAIEIMVTAKKDAIVVVEKGDRLAGILSNHDIINAIHVQNLKGSTINGEHVVNWMTSKVITCSLDTKLAEALKLMGKHQIHHLVVVDQKKPAAVVSIKDILSEIHKNDELEINVLRDLAVTTRATLSA